MSKKTGALGTDPFTHRGMDTLIPPSSIDVQNAQDASSTHHAQEKQTATTIQKRAGEKGVRGDKLPRINMAFDLENLQYLRIMAAGRQATITTYVNRLVELDREANQDRYEQLKRLMED